MALALESLTFSVETKELENAIQKIKELGQAASSLNKPIEQLAKTATDAGKKVEKAAAASESMAASSNKAKTATESFGKSQEKASSGTDKLQALLDRLSNTYSDLSNGMTRGESNILNTARSFGVLEDQLQPVRKILEQIKELSKDPFDAAIGSVRRISQEFEQFKQRTDLAEKGIFLTTKQLQEYSKIANEIKGKLVSTGVKEGSAEYQAQFNAMLAETNAQYLDYVSKLNAGLAAEKERNKQLAEQERLLKQNATAMDAVVNRWKQMQAQKADQEANKQLAEQNRLMQQGLTMMDSAVQKYKASQIAKEQEQLNEQLREQNRLQQQGATAMDSAVIEFYNRKYQAIQDLVKAEQFLATQEEKLQFVTAKTAEGFTVASANALYRYEQSLKKAGVTEQEFIGRSSAYATALKARQDVSDANRGKIQATQELIRIEQQLEDQEKFVAYATAEYNKQQQQATRGTQAFSDTLNTSMLRSLFAYEQALRRTGAAEVDVAAKSAIMRKQLLQMQQSMQSFNGSVNHLGRNIAVQFTDIFVSLYNGQPVMQVITQQGGQIADAFLMAGESGTKMSQHLVEGLKTITEAYKMLAVAVLGFAGTGLEKFFSIFDNGLANISKSIDKTTADSERFGLAMQGLSEMAGSALRANLILIGVAVAAMAVELLKADFAVDKLNKTLIQYGASLGITAQQGEELAMQVGEATTASIGSAREAILAFAKEGVEVTAESVAKAVELNDYLGISFEDAAKKAAQFKKEPVEALIEMAKKTGEVDLETLKYVSSLELAGDQQGAIKAAIEAKDRAETAAITRARAGLSEVSKAWLAIKQQISQAFDELVVFLTSSKEMRTVYAGLGAAITLIFHTVAKAYEGIRGIFSVLAAALTGNFDNVNSAINESANRINNLDNSAKEMYQKLLAFATADTKVNNDASEAAARRAKENAKAAGQFEKEQGLRKQLAKDLGKADADKLSKQAYINASIAEEMRLLGFVTKDQELLNALTKKYGEEWEKANKETGKPGTTFTTNTGNQIVETSKQFEQRLQLEQRLVANQVKTLENYYEAGLYSMGSFLAQETNAVLASKEKQLQIIEEYSRAELAAYDERQAKLEANAAIEIAKGGDRKAIYEQLGRELKNLALSKQTFNEKITGQQETVYSNALKTLSKSMDEVSKITGVVTKEVAGFNEELDKQQQARKSDIDFMSQTIGMTEREIAVLKAKNAVIEQSNKLAMKTAEAQAAAEATFWEYVQNIDPMQPEALDKAWGMWQQIQKSKEAMIAAGIRSEEEQRQAMSDAALAYDLANYKKLKDGIADAISTALFEGGKQGRKKLRDVIVAELRKPITLQINAFVNAVLSDVIGQPGNASSGQGANSDILGAFNSAFKLINNSISASITKGFTSFATSDAGIKMGLGTSNTSTVGPVKPGLTNTGTAVSSSLNMAGNAYAGYSLQKSISGGYKTGESELVDAATVIASAISGPLAGAVAGGFNRAFGRKLKDQGLEGTFGGADGFDGNSYEFYKGGWFRSDKTKRKALDADVEDALETQFKALQTQTAMMAQTLGLGVDSVANFTAKIKVSFKGLNEEQISQRMAEEFGKVAESMASAALGTTEYARTGETAVETLTRLSSSLTTVNGTFDVLGRTLYSSTLAGADMASQLVDSMGGQEAFVKATSAYYDSFYTEAERTETATRQLTEALKSIGVDTLPGTKDAFRDLVEAQDLTTASGREMFASLIALAPAFDSIVDSVESVEQAYARLRAVNLSNEEIAQQRIDLEDQLFGITADTNAIRTRELELIDPSNRALQERIWALEDEAVAADERLGLEQQLLQLQSNTTELRRRELEQIDPSNRALQESIWALEDYNAAMERQAEVTQRMSDLTEDYNQRFKQQSIGTQVTDIAVEFVKAFDGAFNSDRFTAVMQVLNGVGVAGSSAVKDIEEFTDWVLQSTDATEEQKIATLEAANALYDLSESSASIAEAFAYTADDLKGLSDSIRVQIAQTTQYNNDYLSGVLNQAGQIVAEKPQALIDAERSLTAAAEELQKQIAGNQANIDIGYKSIANTIGGLIDKFTPASIEEDIATQEQVIRSKSYDTLVAMIAQEDESIQQQLERLLPALKSIKDAEQSIVNAQRNYDKANSNLATEMQKWSDAITESQDAVAEVTGALVPLYQEQVGLNAELLRLQGDEQGARAIERQEYLAQATAGLSEATALHVQLIYDQNIALQDSITITREKLDLEQRLFEATATEEQIANKAREAIDSHNKVLYDEVIAAEKAKAANEALIAAQSSFASQKLQDDVRLLEAQGKIEEAASKQRELFITELEYLSEAEKEVKIATYDYTKSIDDQIEAINKANEIEQERLGLEQQILQLLGDTASLRALELAKLDPSNRSLQERIYELEDEAKAMEKVKAANEALIAAQSSFASQKLQDDVRLLEAQGKTEEAASKQRELFISELEYLSEAEKEVKIATYDYTKSIDDQIETINKANEIEQERLGLEQQILQLLGDTASLRALELANLDPSNRSLQERIYELEDEAKAMEKANEIEQERLGLEQQILQLLGDTASLRALELANLDPSNRSLQERIYELEDEAKAMEKVKAIADERLGLEQQILQLQGDTAALRALELAKLDPSNRSLQERIYELEDEAKAMEKVKAANEALIAAQSSSASQKLQDDIRLLEAQGKIEEAASKQRELFITELEYLSEAEKEVKIATYDYTKSIDDQIEAINKAKEIAKTKTDADIRLLEAQGNIAEAERLQREQFIIGLSDLTEVQKQAEIGAYDYAKAIDKQIAILKERTGLENSLHQLLGNTAILRERELAALDPSNRALQQRIWAIEDAESALDKAKSATEEAMSKVREIADSQITELEKQATATDRVYESLSNAVEKQKESLNKELERATEQSQNLKDIFDTLTQGIKDLRSEAESTKQIGIDEARSLIRTATATGVLPEKDKLSEAVSVLNAGVTEGVYSTKVEQQKAMLLLSNDLEALKNVAEPQLTTGEATVKSLENQIKQLDDLLQSSKEQIDIARGIDVKVMTVADAQSKLQSAIAAEKQSLSQIAEIKRQVELAEQQYNVLNNINTGVTTLVDAIASLSKAIADQQLAQGLLNQAKSTSNAGSSSGSYTPAPSPTPSQPAPVNPVIPLPTLTNGVLTEAQRDSYVQQVNSAGAELRKNPTQELKDYAYATLVMSTATQGVARPDVSSKYNVGSLESTFFNALNGLSRKEIAELSGYSDKEFYDAGVRMFADGGYYPGGLALVGEEGPELINFSNPGMVYTAAQSANLMQADNSELAEELRALRQEVQMLRAEARATAVNTSKTARILDDVTQGGDTIKTEVAA